MGSFQVDLNRKLLNKVLESELKIKTHILSDLKTLTGWLYLASQDKIQISLDVERGKIIAILFDKEEEPCHQIVLGEFNPGLISNFKSKNMGTMAWMREV